MTALELFTARTGSNDEQFVTLAEDKVRLYLNYLDEDDLTRFSSTVGEIAVLLYEKKQAVQAVQTAFIQRAGLSSKSYSEGPVSVSESYSDTNAGAGVSAVYDNSIKDTLNTLARYRKVRVVTC